MANWHKRTTIKTGNQGQRRTITNSSNGRSTNSYSSKVGNVRSTTSVSSTGKIKVTRTETHPFLGRKTTTQTLNPKPKRQKKSSGYKRKSYRRRSPSGANAHLSPGVVYFLTGCWLVAILFIYMIKG